ncbi:MAG: hypothetical protein KGJ93_02145 [Patescibacteria group bacterium]|nr:hypothetical protein [Patescibacteria group bacterium]
MAKRLFRPHLGGPKGVEQSLTRGLTELGQEFFWNRAPRTAGGVACVLSGTQTLAWAIKQKRAGVFDRLVAGPNIVVVPQDYGELILDPAIDAYLVPAQWSVDWWVSLAPQMRRTLRVWPAGVPDRGRLMNSAGQILVFQKNAYPDILRAVLSELSARSLAYRVIEYGKYHQAEYQSLLSRSKMLIYLSQSESQGLALHEAWMAGVPTLVWNRGFMDYRGQRWTDGKISAPYLNERCGMFFSGEEDFPSGLSSFLGNLSKYDPREYSLQNFTDRASAQKFLNIVNPL